MMGRITLWSSFLLLPCFLFGQWSQPGDRYAYEFDGSSSIIELDNESLFDAASSVVVELDVSFDDVTSSGYKGIVAKRSGVNNVTNFAINYQGSTNQFQWYFNDGSGFSVHVIDLRTYFAVDTWYHIRLSFAENGSNVDSEIIIDGGTPITTTFGGKSLGDNNVPVTIGNSFVGSSQWHTGKIDNLKITVDGKTTGYYLFENGSGTVLSDRLGNADGTISGSGSWHSKATPFLIPPSNLSVWLIADDVDGDGNPGNNSGDYSTWVDLSGNGNNFTSASGKEPTYVGSALNGHAGLDFNGSSDVMTSGTIPALDSVQEYSIFIVFDGDVTTGTDILFVLDTDVNGATININVNNTSNVFNYNLWKDPSTPTGVALASTASNPYVGAFFLSDSDEAWFYLNDTQSNIITGIVTNPERHDDFIIGSGGAAAGTFSFNGKIFEVIIYSSTLSDMGIQQVREYLAAKYGL